MLKSLPFTVFIALLPLINTKINQYAADEKLAALKIQPLLTGVINSYVSAPAMPDADSLKKNNWYSEALKKLQNREYEFSQAAEANTFTTPNRKNNLRFNYSCNGFTVQPRTTRVPVGKPEAIQVADAIEYDNIPDWKVAFSLDKKQVGQGVWHINSNQAEYQTGNIIVQYLNNEEGMRQNFIVREPLNNKEDLKLRFNVSTNLQQQWQKEGLQFYHKSGLVLAYNQLKVWDANGRPLEAAFEKDKNDYCIHVQSSNAVYPITIDPISTTPAAMLESNQASANFGAAVASAGDVNGDGYSDVIVGAYTYDNGESNEGAAFVYLGSAAGISTTPAAMLESNQASANFGYSVAGAGDVNGDGYSDVIVGAYMYDNGQADEGAAFVYHGSAAGISTMAAAMVERNQASANFGYSVAGAGDVNGDGYSDVIVGANMYDNGQADEGAAFIYHGSATGISTTAAAVVESNQASANSGTSVGGAGDVNGDGYSDVIVGAPFFSDGEGNEGAAFIYHGSAAGISTTAATTVESNQLLAFLGISVAGAGDVNGDGYSDVIVGAYLYDHGESNEGAAFIYHGSAAGISTTAAALVESNQASASFGASVAGAGDVNGDGYSDVIVGAYTYDNGISNEGAAFIYQGSAAGISTTAAAMVESNQASAYLGAAVASAGDVNGDGYSDVIVGAYLYDNGESNEGAAFIYHGSAASISTTAAALVESNQASANFGAAVASAGDVNGDGYSDVIVGAYTYDNGESNEGAAFVYLGSAAGISTTPAAMLESNQASANFGYSVAGAGDVNGDGYSDVIVGAYMYDNGQADEGAAFVYHGSAAGISTMAAAMVERNQASANFGYSVAGAGDVNGDGYSDVIVGANMYDNGQADEGAAFIYHGSATGISTTAAAVVESNQASANSGTSVGGAGDVNGDGYSDVIVGAPFFSDGEGNEGAAFIYHGSAAGISTTAATTVESNQLLAFLGISVAGAGDVNGDGYSDVIVGAYLYDHGESNEGAAFIYHGSAAGISTTAAALVESNQASASFGASVAGAGDVNGDGYSDVIVGAYTYDNGISNEGAAFIYQGSAAGISTTAAAMVESNQASAYLGAAVASAGDVNGDGYSDVIVGAYLYDNGESNEGAAFIYHGNSSGTGLRNNLRLYNTDLSTPISSANFSLHNFGAGLIAKSFLGSQKGKLIWETRLNYNAFSGTPITNSVLYTAQGSYTNLGISGTELKNLVVKVSGGRYTKIRARIKYDPVTAITGQLYSPWRYVDNVLLTTSLGALPVNLVSFNASWLTKGKTALLKFVTDNESATCCYEIEKSADGAHFITIGKVTAKNTTGQCTYTYTDNSAGGQKLYYRLKIMFENGNSEYSNIQLLQSNSAMEILVFPNPATDVLQLRVNNNYSVMNVQVINITGQVVQQFNNLSAAGQVISIPVTHLTSGTYFLSLRSDGKKQVLQFVKQ